MTVPLPRVPTIATWAVAPLALAQGFWLRRTALRLPEAARPFGATGEGPEPLRIVVVGDSVAAGVGLESHDESMAGLLAHRLAVAHGRPASWQVIARSGATAGDARALLQDRPELAVADVVLVSIGVNDTKNLHPVARWRQELGELLDTILAAAPGAEVLLFGIPPMDRLPALPRPLAGFMGSRSRVMDRVGAEVAAARPRVRRVVGELLLEDAFASDGFHPSAVLHGHFVDWVLQSLTPPAPVVGQPRT